MSQGLLESSPAAVSIFLFFWSATCDWWERERHVPSSGLATACMLSKLVFGHEEALHMMRDCWVLAGGVVIAGYAGQLDKAQLGELLGRTKSVICTVANAHHVCCCRLRCSCKPKQTSLKRHSLRICWLRHHRQIPICRHNRVAKLRSCCVLACRWQCSCEPKQASLTKHSLGIC
jgi:hypothetical protein